MIEKDEKRILERKEIEKNREIQEENKRKLNYSFTIKDMEQFSEIPFEWCWVDTLSYSNGIAWFMLNKNNQYIALSVLDFINQILVKSKAYTGFTKKLHICTENINFDFPVPMHKDSLPWTYVQCVPYTPKMKLSKHPAVLHFCEYATKKEYCGFESYVFCSLGEIFFMQDGNIGKVNLSIPPYKIQIRLHGLNLIVKRIDKFTSMGNINIYKFNPKEYNAF